MKLALPIGLLQSGGEARSAATSRAVSSLTRPGKPPADAEMGLPLEEGEGDTPNLEAVSVEHHETPEPAPADENKTA